MPRARSSHNSFTAGELTPDLHERYDHVSYTKGAKELVGFLVKPHGSIYRAPGTRHIGSAKNTTASRLMPFVFSSLDGVVIEVGDLYFRFWVETGQVISGTPVEVVTPYSGDELRELHFTQDGDVMIITHPDHAPRQLLRFSATDWELRVIEFLPPPTQEFPVEPATTITLGALTGLSVVVNASAATFLESDVGKLIREDITIGNGMGSIITFITTTQVTMDITTDFTGNPLTSGQWSLSPTPVASLVVEKAQPIGAITTLTLLKSQADATNLVVNGDFGNGLDNWTDFSGPTVTAVLVADGTDDDTLDDAAGGFIAAGVAAGHRAINITDGTEDSVVSVDSATSLTTSTGGAVWGVGDSYQIRQTGAATFGGGQAVLDGGAQGIAWIEQAVTTVAGQVYQVTFDVADFAISAQVGTTSQDDDRFVEASFDVGEGSFSFFATTTTSYIQFRNNQDQSAKLDNVMTTLLNVDGWRSADVGKYVRVNQGIIKVTAVTTASSASGVILHRLVDTVTALEGAWSLEETKWSDARGWPATTTFLGDRLHYASTDSFPQSDWGSKLGVYNDFASGPNDSDALDFTVSATQINRIVWLSGERQLLLGTQREEFGVRGSVGLALTPTSIDVSSPTKVGSHNLQPIRTPRALLFVERGATRLRESLFDFDANERIPQDLSILSEHLVEDGIRSLAYQQLPDPIIWVVTEEDELKAVTYLREHEVVAWSQRQTDGNVLDVTVIPTPDGTRDQVWLLVDRDGSTPSLEYMDDRGCFYGSLTVDAGLTQTYDPATTTITGLDHLEGQTVVALTQGYTQGMYTVSGGSITLGVAATAIEVGLPYTVRLQTLRPTLDGQPLSYLRLSNIRVAVSLRDTINCLLNTERLIFTDNNDLMDTAPSVYVGLKDVDAILQGTDYDATITIEQDQPYPITVLGIFRSLEVEGI